MNIYRAAAAHGTFCRDHPGALCVSSSMGPASVIVLVYARII